MTAQFGHAALHLYGIAARELGWRPEHFWNATPAELLAALAPAPATHSPAALTRADLQKLLECDYDR